MALGSTQPLEMSTRNLPGGKGSWVRKAGNLTAICEPIVSQPCGPSRPVKGIASRYLMRVVACVVNSFHVFNGNRAFMTVLRRPRHWSLSTCPHSILCLRYAADIFTLSFRTTKYYILIYGVRIANPDHPIRLHFI
jgi:hypothetical protein